MRVHVGNLLLVVLEIGSLPSVPNPLDLKVGLLCYLGLGVMDAEPRIVALGAISFLSCSCDIADAVFGYGSLNLARSQKLHEKAHFYRISALLWAVSRRQLSCPCLVKLG